MFTCRLCLAAQMSPDAFADAAMTVAFWMGVACIVGAGVVFFFKVFLLPRMGGDLGSADKKQAPWRAEDFSLDALDALKDEGKLTPEEYERAAAKVRARAAHDAAVAAAAAAQVEPSLFTTSVPPAIRPKTNAQPKTTLPPDPSSTPSPASAEPSAPTEPPASPTTDIPKRPENEPPSGSSPSQKNGELW